MNDSLRIDYIQNKLRFLEARLDSINHASLIKQLEYELYQKQDIISKINEFYDSAWFKLIIVISVLGVVVPFILQYFQRQNLKELTEFIHKQMNDSFESKISDLKKFNQDELNGLTSKLKNELESIEIKNSGLLNELDASTFYMQGRTSILSKQYVSAISSFIRSAYNYVNSERPERANILFVNLKFALKSILDKSQIEIINSNLLKSSLKMDLDEVLEYFKSNSNVYLYQEKLKDVIEQVERIKNAPNIKIPSLPKLPNI